MLQKLIQLESTPFLQFWLSWIINHFWQLEEWIITKCLPISITKKLKGSPVLCRVHALCITLKYFSVMAAGQIKFVFNILYVGVPRLLTIETYREIQGRKGVLFSSIDFFESLHIHSFRKSWQNPIQSQTIPSFSSLYEGCLEGTTKGHWS